MPPLGSDALLTWTSYELVEVESGDVVRAPFMDAIGHPSEAVKELKIMSRVEDLGWPDAMKLTIGGRSRKRRIVKKDDAIYLLKCTPSCWRFYFYVHEDSRSFVYVHAVCKQQDAEDPSDAVIARERYEARATGRGRCKIEFP